MKLVTADWCNSCSAVKQFLKDGSYDRVLVVDAETHPLVVTSAGIKSLPTLLVNDGTKVVGAVKIIQFIKENYDSNPNA